MRDNKKLFRSRMLEKRGRLSQERKKDAERSFREYFLEVSTEHAQVLSYASFNDELMTCGLNQYLVSVNKLVLPYVEGQYLRFFRIENLQNQIAKSKWGIDEPIPEECEEVNIDSCSLILVPGLAFDRKLNRLGYGKGFYDRFLACLPSTHLKLGVGYKEQLVEHLPNEPHDTPLSSLALF